MEPVELSLAKEAPRGSYDEGADVLYISLGEPRPALGVDVGDGLIVLYDEDTNEIVGVTIIGLRKRAEDELSQPMPEELAALVKMGRSAYFGKE